MINKSTIGIPVISDNAKIWMIRTQSGKYYTDFVKNNYVALGWDKIDVNRLEGFAERDAKTAYIKEKYPKEKRPGLILGQIETFTHKISPGDYILIPSKGGNYMSLGIANGKVSEIIHEKTDEDYEKCDYHLKISVSWIGEICTYQDIYLFKILRAVQTISDLTKYKDLILRNSYDLFVSGNSVHLMLKKETKSACLLENRLSLDSSIYQIFKSSNEIFDSRNLKIEYKTAISSPGFIEIILPMSGSAVFLACVVAYALKSKESKDGVSVAGISAILKSISDLFNDKVERDYKRTQIRKIEVETESLELDNEFKKIKLCEEKDRFSKLIEANKENIQSISSETVKLQQAARDMGIGKVNVDE